MVHITPSTLLSVFLTCTALSSAAPVANKRQAAGKRVLAWDYTNTNDPAVASKLNDAGIGSSQFVAVHNWNPWIPQELTDKNRFQPTVRDIAQTQTGSQEWGWVQDFARNHPNAHIHTFNEPERAGISPQAAADAWNGNLAQLRAETGAKLITPAITNTQEGINWLNTFCGLIANNPPDFLGLHFYDNTADNLMGYLQARHAEHAYPIVLSELAANVADEGTVSAITRKWANELDDSDIVYQYAFFGAMRQLPPDGGFFQSAALLMNPDGSFKSLLTDLINGRPL